MLRLGSLLLAALPGAGEAQAPPTPTPYVDRVIDPAQLASLPPEPSSRYEVSGLPRSYSLEATWGFADFGEQREEETGVAGSGYWESPLWGAFSIDAGVYKPRSSDDYVAFGSIWQRGLHLDGGWRADNGIGVLNTLAPDLQRRQARFFLPGSPILGAVSQWRSDSGLQLQASAGTPGVFASGRLSGFEADDGRLVALGADWIPAMNWRSSLSMISTQGRDLDIETPGYGARDGDSVFLGSGWSGDLAEVQMNLVSTRNEREEGAHAGSQSSTGAWVDARLQRGWYHQTFGAFHLEPDLNWGGEPMNNDARGAYYRISHQRMRWSWSASVDHLQALSGTRRASSFASGTMRYQLSSSLGLGGATTLRRGRARAWTAQLFADQRNRLGITRAQLDLADDDTGNSAWRTALTQSFPTTVGSRLSVTASHEETRRDGRDDGRISALVLYGSRDMWMRLSLDGTARYSTATGSGAHDGFYANLGLNWRLNQDWRLLLTYDRSTISRRNAFVLDPFPEPVEGPANLDAESFFITLRYAYRAGRSGPVLGGGPGAPAGFIQGTVFLDENPDGIRDGTEAGAANVTVLLDDRFAVRTDSQGNFAFPMVATGLHTIRVVQDNLPLPWSFDESVAEQAVEVRVRQSVHLSIPASRGP